MKTAEAARFSRVQSRLGFRNLKGGLPRGVENLPHSRSVSGDVSFWLFGLPCMPGEPVPDCDPLAGTDQAVPGSGTGGPWRNREFAEVALAGLEWTNPSLIFRVGDVSRIANTGEEISDELSFKWADLESDYWDTTVRGIRV